MDPRHFDDLTKSLPASGARRRLMHLLTVLPLAGALAAVLGEEGAAKGRRAKRKKGHHERTLSAQKKGKKKGKSKKKKCQPASQATTCAGRCGGVTNNCSQLIDCGSCDCPAPCNVCQSCQSAPGVPGTCVPAHAGEACGAGQVCLAGACVACGSSGEPCCAADACDPGSDCVAGHCMSCGGVNQPCCGGTTCAGSTICLNGSCCDGCRGDDGSCGTCLVFVTSGELTGALGGFDGADSTCLGLAFGAGLPRSDLAGNYKVWLSIGSPAGQNPLTRFRHSGQPYRLPDVDHMKVADNWTALTTCAAATCLHHAIDHTETGAQVSGEVWTNTNGNGVEISPLDCGGWTSAGDDSGSLNGITGTSTSTSGFWTSGHPRDCGLTHRLYCF